MIVPGKKLSKWSLDIIEKCLVSRKQRVNAGALYKQYYYNGTSQPAQAPYNLCLPHIDRTSSQLFSPVDVNFRLHSGVGESNENVPKDWQETWVQRLSIAKKKPEELKWANWRDMRHIAAHFLNAEVFNAEINEYFSLGLDIALMKGSAFIRTLWGHDGLDPYIFNPEQLGVYNESVNGLHRQEAFVCTSYISLDQLAVIVRNKPNRAEIMDKVRKRAARSKASERFENDFLHQIVIGGTASASNPSGNIKASTNIFGTPYPQLSPDVQNSLLVCHELWVQDEEREDYTTIQLIEPDIIIEGEIKHRNISGVKGETGFKQICPNPVIGYFWGMSDLMPLRPLQDMANTRVAQINRVLKRRARPANALSGFQGDTDQAKKALDAPDGLIVDSGPGMKVTKMQPDNPTDLYENLRNVVEMFDNIGGANPITKGEGESGVRSGVHADTLVRQSSPRLRDRALRVERQYGDVGDFCFKLLQAKNASEFVTRSGESFLLSQLPDDTKVIVDGHSGSPIFSQENRELAFALRKFEAIDNVDLIQMVGTVNEDELVQKARAKEEAQQKLLAEHPELLEKIFHGKKK